MTYDDLVKKIQSVMNAEGSKLTVDGDLGPVTKKELEKYSIELKVKKIAQVEDPKPISTDWFNAPWVGANIDMLGLKEGDPKLEARFVPEWKLEGLPGYKTLKGKAHAWCSVVCNADLRKVGVKGTNSAAASSWSKWGKKSPFWFGAILDIRHKGGGRHCCKFLYWIDEDKKICASLDGNRSDTYGVFRTDLSGKGDTLVTGPRWSNDWLNGREVAMAEVLAKYPMLKVGSSGSSTT